MQDKTPHEVHAFRDPATGDYYVQNYGVIFKVGKNLNLAQVIDFSTQFHSAFAGSSYVEGAPGKIRLYEPRTARWIASRIDRSVRFDEPHPVVEVRAGNNEIGATVQVGKQGKNFSGKLVYEKDSFATPEGLYNMQFAGIAVKSSGSKTLKDVFIDELRAEARLHGGMLWFDAPNLGKGFPGRSDSDRNEATSLVYGLNLRGEARINTVTGKLEMMARGNDVRLPVVKDGQPQLSAPYHEIKTGLEYKPGNGPVTVEGTRIFQITPKSMNTVSAQLTTAADKYSLIYDMRSGRYYVQNGADLFIFSGTEKMDAVAVRNRFKAGVDAKKLGEFIVIYDYSKVVQNKSGDALFKQVPVHQDVKLQWKKRWTKMMSTTGEVGYAGAAQPISFLEQFDAVTPGVNVKSKGGVYVGGMMSFSF